MRAATKIRFKKKNVSKQYSLKDVQHESKKKETNDQNRHGREFLHSPSSDGDSLSVAAARRVFPMSVNPSKMFNIPVELSLPPENMDKAGDS